MAHFFILKLTDCNYQYTTSFSTAANRQQPPVYCTSQFYSSQSETISTVPVHSHPNTAAHSATIVIPYVLVLQPTDISHQCAPRPSTYSHREKPPVYCTSQYCSSHRATISKPHVLVLQLTVCNHQDTTRLRTTAHGHWTAVTTIPYVLVLQLKENIHQYITRPSTAAHRVQLSEYPMSQYYSLQRETISIPYVLVLMLTGRNHHYFVPPSTAAHREQPSV